jgi:hypothetical protein
MLVKFIPEVSPRFLCTILYSYKIAKRGEIQTVSSFSESARPKKAALISAWFSRASQKDVNMSPM